MLPYSHLENTPIAGVTDRFHLGVSRQDKKYREPHLITKPHHLTMTIVGEKTHMSRLSRPV